MKIYLTTQKVTAFDICLASLYLLFPGTFCADESPVAKSSSVEASEPAAFNCAATSVRDKVEVEDKTSLSPEVKTYLCPRVLRKDESVLKTEVPVEETTGVETKRCKKRKKLPVVRRQILPKRSVDPSESVLRGRTG